MKKLFLILHIFIVPGLSSCNKTENLESVSSNYSKIDSIQIHYITCGSQGEKEDFTPPDLPG